MTDLVIDFENARTAMVECQVLPGGVRDKKICSILRQVPRECFVPQEFKNLAYMDNTVPLKEGREMISPLAFARLVELADVRPDDLVLDIGCAYGYSAAVLASLAGTVVAVEQDETYYEAALAMLEKHGADNAVLVQAEHAKGQPKQGPFDVIFIGGMVPQVPGDLLEQLNEGGRLVCVGMQDGASRGMIYRRYENGFSSQSAFDISAPEIPGFEVEKGFTF